VVQEFSDRAAVNAAVPGVNVFDFETTSGYPSAPAALDFINATIDLGTPGGDSVVRVQNFGNGFGQSIGGSSGGQIDNFRPVVITFSAPYYAVGLDDVDLTQSDEFAIIDVASTSGTVRYLRTDPDSSFSTAPFFGVWSDQPINSVTVWSSDTADGVVGGRANLIDNLAVSRIAVPEPTLIAVLGTSALVIGLGRRCISSRSV
jgi:hypothetical protein